MNSMCHELDLVAITISVFVPFAIFKVGPGSWYYYFLEER
jgi:hypothetical protein